MFDRFFPMNPVKVLCVLLLLICFHPHTGHGALTYDPELEWQTLTTTHLRIHFHQGEKHLAQKTAMIGERIYASLATWFNWQPDFIDMILNDRVDYSNGAATPIPRNTMYLFMHPPDDLNTLEEFDDWLDLLIQHEMTHIFHLDKASGFPQDIRKIFGRTIADPFVFAAFPAVFQPVWMQEGLATFQETSLSRKVGRGQSAYFRMLMRMELMGGFKSIRQVNDSLVAWPPNTQYLYGVFFYQFLEERYGTPSIRGWIEEYSDNWIPFGINWTAEQVFQDKDMTELWEEFSVWIHARFQPEMEELRQHTIEEGERLTSDGYMTSMPQVTEDGSLWYLRNDYKSAGSLMRQIPGRESEAVLEVTHQTRFDADAHQGVLLTQLDLVRNLNTWSDLYHFNPETGELRQITEGGRYLFAIWGPEKNDILAVHTTSAGTALRRLNLKGEVLETLWDSENQEIISWPDLSPDGQNLVAMVWKPGKRWNLELFSLQNHTWTPLLETLEIEAHPRFSSEGTNVIFSANYGGRYNIYQLNLSDQQITPLTYLAGGGFYPFPAGDHLYYAGMSVTGLNIYRIALQSLPLPVSTETSPMFPLHDETTMTDADKGLSQGVTEPYSPWPGLKPTFWTPYLNFDSIRGEAGIMTGVSDPLNRHTYNLLAAYDVTNNWPLGTIMYSYDRWDPTLIFRLSREYRGYFDDFSEPPETAEETSIFRKITTFGAEMVFPWLKIQRQWLLRAGVLDWREELVDLRPDNISAALPLPDIPADSILGLALQYHSTKTWELSVSETDGTYVSLIAEDSDLLNNDYTGQVYTLDWRQFITITGLNVWAFRTTLGWGTDNPRPFQLGGNQQSTAIGQGSGSADNSFFGVRDYALRGYPEGLPDLRGRFLTLFSTEWRFPIARVERHLMTPPVGIHQLYGALFAENGDAGNQSEDAQKPHRSAGMEISFELLVGYSNALVIRTGVAQGLDEGGIYEGYISTNTSF
ncbi:MAG: PD40 domain-containing protein [SAR324 cluster bacterium]|nr:PD40 domain-containing protein [SAR324 cluster bacterium]